MDNNDREKIEQNRSALGMWVDKLNREGIVDVIDPSLVRSVLESYGANFEISEESKESLKRFNNAERRPGMDAVWGSDNVKKYRIWLKHWVVNYENKTGRQLPVLEGTNTKTSGGLKFFTDLTVFAAGLMTFEKYKEITERRAEKGRLWQARNLNDPYETTKYSSFPPEFPSEAWEKIKSLNQEML